MGKTNLDDLETMGDVTVKGGDITLDDTTINEAEIGVLDAVTPGTSKANAAAVLGANKNLDVLVLPVSGLKIGSGAGTAVARTAAELNALAQGVAAGYKIARGQHTTASAVDTIATGLATVVSVVASYESDPGDANLLVSAQVGDQAGAPVAGSIIIKTWKTDGADPTPVAATSFGKLVNWIAIGV